MFVLGRAGAACGGHVLRVGIARAATRRATHCPQVARRAVATVTAPRRAGHRPGFHPAAVGALASAISSLALCEARRWDSASQSATLYAQLDMDFEDNEYAKIAAAARDALAAKPDDAQLLWRLARALKKLADAEGDKKQKERLVREGLAHATRALEIQPDCGAVNKWYGIMLSTVGAFDGTTATIKNSYRVAEMFERAVALSPGDATARHLLGLWCFEIAKLSWIEKKAAAALFATPPTSSYEAAYAHFATAEETSPGFYPKNRLYLALTCARLGRVDEAREWRDKCLAMAPKTPEDEETLAEARKLKL